MRKETISRFREKPKIKTAWRAMYLGLSTLLIPPFLGFFAAVIRPMIDRENLAGREGTDRLGMSMGFGVAILSLALSVSALVAGVRAYKAGERSWVLWLGFIPAILIGVFWIFMIVGELLFPHRSVSKGMLGRWTKGEKYAIL